VSPWRRAWRALTCRGLPIKEGEVWELIGSRDDPYRAHYSVTIVRQTDDGRWVEFRYRYGTVSSLRRDIFVSVYQKAKQ
jgi:hypothetical protein